MYLYTAIRHLWFFWLDCLYICLTDSPCLLTLKERSVCLCIMSFIHIVFHCGYTIYNIIYITTMKDIIYFVCINIHLLADFWDGICCSLKILFVYRFWNFYLCALYCLTKALKTSLRNIFMYMNWTYITDDLKHWSKLFCFICVSIYIYGISLIFCLMLLSKL